MRIDFFLELVSQSFGNAVDAAYGRHNPYLVTHTHLTVLADIALEGTVLLFDVECFINRLVGVFQCAGEIGLEVVFVYPLSSLQVLEGMTNGVAVLDDVLTLLLVGDENFVSCRRVLQNGNLFAVNFNDVTLFLFLQADDNGVGGVNLKISSLFHLFYLIICYPIFLRR